MLHVGIDIAKNNHEAVIVDDQGNRISKRILFSNTKEGFEKLLMHFKKHSVTTENTIVAMEATGHYWLALYSALVDQEYDVKVINPIQTSVFRKLYLRKAKTDAIDAFIIAQVIRFGEYSASAFMDEKTLALRQLSRYRVMLVDSRSSWKVKVIALLDQVFPEYASLFSRVFAKSSVAVLLAYPSAQDIANANIRSLTSIIEKSSKGRLGREKAIKLKESVKTSFGVCYAKDMYTFQIRQMLNQIQFLDAQIEELEVKIELLVEQSDTYITTITGVSKITAAVLLGEIGDITRFKKANQLVAFAGLDVSVHRSGEFVGTRNKLSKRGSPYLRKALWMTAFHDAFSDPVLSRYYKQLRERGKRHSIAISAVARKLCNIIFAVLRDNKPYYIPNITTLVDDDIPIKLV